MKQPRLLAVLLPVLLPILLGGACASVNNPFASAREAKTPAQVREAADNAEKALAEGHTARALSELRVARSLRGLEPDLRDRVDRLTVIAAERRVDELSQPGADPAELAALFELNLPRQVKVTAAIRAASLYREQGRLKRAFKMIKKVDTAYPPAGTHHERVAAGGVLSSAGLERIKSTWSFLGMFRAADLGVEMLEYLVINYPAEARCDEAYFALAEIYAKRKRWVLARERYEDLLRYHPASPLALESEARVPRMRLTVLSSPEYDRRELVRARAELDLWLQKHAESAPAELTEHVRLDLADCLGRLIENDLGVARFYQRIDKDFGVRYHAERALEVAERAGDERGKERAQALLDSVPPATEAEKPAEAPPAAVEENVP